ncbi:MAG: hypothetical protein ACI9HG_002189, partial [Flavobacteriales bacterium]
MKQIFIFSLVLLALTSCRKDEDEIVDGPNLNDLFGPFSIVEDIVINRTMVDFPNDGLVYYSGELSKNTDWFIY